MIETIPRPTDEGRRATTCSEIRADPSRAHSFASRRVPRVSLASSRTEMAALARMLAPSRLPRLVGGLWNRTAASTAESVPSPSPLQMVPQEEEEKVTSPSRVGERAAFAVWKGAPISPRKLNLVAALVRGLGVEDAMIQCNLLPKKAARMVEKVVQSAASNAVHNHGLEKEKLFVKEAYVGKGIYLKRISIHGRGRAGVMHKKRANLTVVVKEADEPQKLRVHLVKPANERKRKGFHWEGEAFEDPSA
mmetsp:Transcript_5184/g.18291  ORF Transcript_5184/g.18291 Transcript_5184/m.18291 type:complete len:249 (+) Transcript_5184:3-749(+)